MGRRPSGTATTQRMRIQMITAPRNWAIIRLLGDGKARMPSDMVRELKGHYKQANVFAAARELAAAGIITPTHVAKERGGFVVGYTLNPKLKGVLALLEKAEKEAGKAVNWRKG